MGADFNSPITLVKFTAWLAQARPDPAFLVPGNKKPRRSGVRVKVSTDCAEVLACFANFAPYGVLPGSFHFRIDELHCDAGHVSDRFRPDNGAPAVPHNAALLRFELNCESERVAARIRAQPFLPEVHARRAHVACGAQRVPQKHRIRSAIAPLLSHFRNRCRHGPLSS